MKFLIRTFSSDPNNPEQFYFTQSESSDSCWTKYRKLAKEFDDYISADIVRDDLFEGEIINAPHSLMDVILRYASILYVCLVVVPFLIALRVFICAFEIINNFTLYNFTRIILPDELLTKISTGTMSYGFLKIMFAITLPISSCFYETRASIKSIKF